MESFDKYSNRAGFIDAMVIIVTSKRQVSSDKVGNRKAGELESGVPNTNPELRYTRGEAMKLQALLLSSSPVC